MLAKIVSPGDPLKKKLFYSAHLYFDPDNSGSYNNGCNACADSTHGVTQASNFIGWLQKYNFHGMFTEYGVPSCSMYEACEDNFLHTLDTSKLIFGGTAWAAGPWWGNNDLSVEPLSATTDTSSIVKDDLLRHASKSGSLPVNAGAITGSADVCQKQSSVSYTVPTITNATSYIWTLPNGATGSSTTNSIKVSYGVSAESGNITVEGSNSCGNGSSSTLAVTVNPIPATAETISGTETVCQGQNDVIYTVPEITNATSYIWTLPTGATGSGITNSITVNYGTSAVSGNITVQGSNSCGTGASSTLAITVNPLPAGAGTIAGNAAVCQGQNAITYKVPVITNATLYIWALPTGATGSSTTNSITVNYGSSSESGNITVQGSNSCGVGAASRLAIIVNSIPAPASAGIISGSGSVCQGQNDEIYSVPEITNATSYTWTMPNGTTGSSTTNSIIIDFGTSAVSGNITVQGINSCGVGATSTMAITVNSLPASAGTISGNTNVCQGDNEVSYTVPEISNAALYIWTLPTGSMDTSISNGIDVNYASSISGTLSVKGENYCGEGSMSSISVIVHKTPATPIITRSGDTLRSNAAEGNQWYNKSGLINDAANQIYEVSADGNYYVISTVDGCSSAASNTIEFVITDLNDTINNSIKVYPNPVTDELVIELFDITEKTSYEIINSTGEIVLYGNLNAKTTITTSNLPDGLYLIKISMGDTVEFYKIIKK
jgi:stress response protein SCP2